MAIQAKDSCTKCNIAFALAEKREVHKGEEYHPECWARAREDALRLLLRLNASRDIAHILRR
jgi:hypothetical protein